MPDVSEGNPFIIRGAREASAMLDAEFDQRFGNTKADRLKELDKRMDEINQRARAGEYSRFQIDSLPSSHMSDEDVRKLADFEMNKTGCHAGRQDGECYWSGCPQLRDGEPKKTGRHCPLDKGPDPEE